jgi:hypothetical protein
MGLHFFYLAFLCKPILGRISPLLLEQRERKEGCPDERQRCLDGVVIKYKKN